MSESVNLAYHGLRASDSNFTIALESDYDPTLPTIQGVPRDLSRVFLNMVNNAATRRIRKSLERGRGFARVCRCRRAIRRIRLKSASGITERGSQMTFCRRSSIPFSRPNLPGLAPGLDCLSVTRSSWTSTKGPSASIRKKANIRSLRSACRCEPEFVKEQDCVAAGDPNRSPISPIDGLASSIRASSKLN